jgi:DNA ligase 1
MFAGFNEFAALSEALSNTSRKLEKRSRIAEWLRSLAPPDAAVAALYLAGQAFPENERRSLNLGGAILSRAVMQLAGANDAALHNAYLKHGDLGAAAFELMSGKPAVADALTLNDVVKAFDSIAATGRPQVKLQFISELLSRSTPLEAKYLIKLASGDMRTGVRQSLIEEAIAEAYSADVSSVRRAVMLVGDLGEVVKMAASGTLDQAQMKMFHSLGFMLASPVATVAEALGRFAREIADEQEHTEHSAFETRDVEATPPAATVDIESHISEAMIEDKYDGIRCQLHCGDPCRPGLVALFSRTREDLTAAFPELATAFSSVQKPLILDGEILAWDPADRRALAFASLQKRIGRKVVSREMRDETPVVFMAFDILYADGELLLNEPLSKRRLRLEMLYDEFAPQTVAGSESESIGQSLLFAPTDGDGVFSRLILSPAEPLTSAEQLEQAYANARDRGNEGVMIKARSSVYQPGRRGLAWLKLKRELATLDVVVTAAEFGHGKRAGVLSDYTFAVRDGERLLNVGKAYSGLTDVEIDQLTAFFFEHTVEDFGRVRSVEPLIVLEVAFNNVMRSERHDSGFALRFPRILRIRDDKPVAEIDTLNRVEEIYASQPDRPK